MSFVFGTKMGRLVQEQLRRTEPARKSSCWVEYQFGDTVAVKSMQRSSVVRSWGWTLVL